MILCFNLCKIGRSGKDEDLNSQEGIVFFFSYKKKDMLCISKLMKIMIIIKILSISVVPSFSTTSEDDKYNKTEVIGARYTYNSLVTFHDASLKPVMLPSQYPALNNQISSHQQQQTGNKSVDKHSKKNNHARSTSTQKSFNAFLKDTNDEWSDDIHEPGKQPSIVTSDPSIDHNTLAKASKAVETVLSTITIPVDPSSQPPRKKKSINPNGIKDHIEDILLGKKITFQSK